MGTSKRRDFWRVWHTTAKIFPRSELRPLRRSPSSDYVNEQNASAESCFNGPPCPSRARVYSGRTRADGRSDVHGFVHEGPGWGYLQPALPRHYTLLGQQLRRIRGAFHVGVRRSPWALYYPPSVRDSSNLIRRYILHMGFRGMYHSFSSKIIITL